MLFRWRPVSNQNDPQEKGILLCSNSDGSLYQWQAAIGNIKKKRKIILFLQRKTNLENNRN